MHTLPRLWPLLGRRDTVTSSTGWIALLLCLISTSTFNTFAKSLTGTLSPLSLIFISEILTLAFVGLSFGLWPVIHQLIRLERKTLIPLVIMGCFSGVAGPYLWFRGLMETTAMSATFFSKVELIFMLILASTYIHEKVTRRHVMASLIILFGVIVIALRGFTDGIHVQRGDLIIVASVLCYSLGSSIFRRHLSHIKPELAVFARSMTAICAFFLASPFLQHPFIEELQHFPRFLIPTLLSFALISRFLSTFTFYEAIEHIPVSVVYPTLMLEVVGSALLAHMVLGETLAWYHVVGGAFVLLGNLRLHKLGVHDDDQHLEQHAVERLAHRAS